LQDYPTEETCVADGRLPFREMEGSTDIHCSIVNPGRATLAEAIVEALAQLVKPRKRKKSPRRKPKGNSLTRSFALSH
jgi:hypothetical protein